MKTIFKKITLTALFVSTNALAVGNNTIKNYTCASPQIDKKISLLILPAKNLFVVDGKAITKSIAVFGSFEDGAMSVRSEGTTDAWSANNYHGEHDVVIARIKGKNYICQIVERN